MAKVTKMQIARMEETLANAIREAVNKKRDEVDKALPITTTEQKWDMIYAGKARLKPRAEAKDLGLYGTRLEEFYNFPTDRRDKLHKKQREHAMNAYEAKLAAQKQALLDEAIFCDSLEVLEKIKAFVAAL